MRYLVWTLCLTLLFLANVFGDRIHKPVTTQSTQATQAAAKRRERAKQVRRNLDIRRASFSRGRRLLLARGVPFDPDILLRPRWRKALKRHFDTMPEMQATKRVGPRLKGVYMADTLIMPTEIETEDDTVILARKIVYEGCGTTIKSKGLIALFPIEPIEGRISINEFKRLQQRQSFGHSFAPSTTAINLSGFRRVGAYMQGQCGTNLEAHGANRNQQAAEGEFVNPNPPPPGTGPTGASGECSGDPNGREGGLGQIGSPGPNGSPGNPGIPGGDAGIIMCTIPCGSTSTYTFAARGGNAQQGGVGARGTPGAQGQKGGPGGPGANCCNINGIRGNGGTGGRGGKGGPGGLGGRGGNGGTGGTGGSITIDYPKGFMGTINPVFVTGGDPGGVGGPGLPAIPSSGGEPGDPGPPAPSPPSCGFPSPGNPGNTGMEGLPGDGTLGPGINTGSNGGIGTYDPREYTCPGDEDEDSDGYSPNDDDCDDTDPSINPGEDPYCFTVSWDVDNNCNGIPDIDEFLCTSPIIINFTGGLRLTSPDDGVLFDIAGVGIKRLLSWTRPGADDAFLALDRNGNGTIDDGGELFGARTRLLNGSYPAHNGFEVLAEFDLPAAGGNNNGVIDDGDVKFSQLLAWQDTNHNGISEATELRPLSATNIDRIEVEYHYSSRQDQYGNEFLYRAKVFFRNEKDLKHIDSHRKWAYDVGLASAR